MQPVKSEEPSVFKIYCNHGSQESIANFLAIVKEWKDGFVFEFDVTSLMVKITAIKAFGIQDYFLYDSIFHSLQNKSN